jgi:hypothetical protein
VTTVTIDGVPWRHLLFIQPPGIELELWVEKNERFLARRLIVTCHNPPGQPNFRGILRPGFPPFTHPMQNSSFQGAHKRHAS